MKRKTLAGLIVAVCVLSSATFGQTVSITGTVAVFTDAQISLTSGSDLWNIVRNATTTVTSGTLAVGNTVTVQCASADATKIKGGGAQKKE
jgi:hypothetical protein